MNITAGKILTSSATMDDSIFQNTVIFIAEHNANGTMGFVINKVFERPLNALEEFSSSPAFPLYNGGPVDKEHLFFVHQRPDIIANGTKITDTIYLGGNFKQAIIHLNNKTLTTADIKVFIGYCGWDAQELEAEVAEGSWIVSEGSYEIIFT